MKDLWLILNLTQIKVWLVFRPKQLRTLLLCQSLVARCFYDFIFHQVQYIFEIGFVNDNAERPILQIFIMNCVI